MLQSEFEARVKMQVSCEEFQSINGVYNHSSLDKDEFCKAWVRMNKERVEKAVAEAKERERVSVLKDKAWDIIASFRDNFRKLEMPASKSLNKTQRAFCESVGIKIRDVEGNPYMSTTLRTVVFQLRRFALA